MAELKPEVVARMQRRLEMVDAAIKERAKYAIGSPEYLDANLGVCRAIGDSHWIVEENWRELIALAVESLTRPAPAVDLEAMIDACAESIKARLDAANKVMFPNADAPISKSWVVEEIRRHFGGQS